MKILAPAVLLLLVASIGHSAEPLSTLPDAEESQPASPVVENAAPKRLSLHQRLSAPFMEVLDADRKKLAEKVQPIEVPYKFVRGTFHFHSHFSHDSIGTLEEIVAAAKATGTQIIGFSEHPDRAATPEKLVDAMADLLLAVPIPDEARRELINVASRHKNNVPQGANDVLRTLAALPEFQLG